MRKHNNPTKKWGIFESLSNKPLFLLIFFLAGIWLRSEAQDIYEPNNDYETPTIVLCGQQYEAYIQETGDSDFYLLEVLEDGIIEVIISSVPNNIDIDVNISSFDQFGIQTLITTDGFNNASGGQIMFATAVVAAGTYQIIVQDESNNAANNTDSYLLTISCTPDDLELNQTWQTAVDLDLNSSYQNRIYGSNFQFTPTSDWDWFKLTLPESGELAISATEVPPTIDLDMVLYKEGEFEPIIITSDNDPNSDGGQSILLTAILNSGQYYLRLVDEGSNAQDSGYFSLDITYTEDVLEYNQIWEDALAISIDTCFQERIYGLNLDFPSITDQDWYRLIIDQPGVIISSLTSISVVLDMTLDIWKLGDLEPILITNDGSNNAGFGESRFAQAVVDPGEYLISIRDEGDNGATSDYFDFCVSFEPDDLELNQIIDQAKPISSDTCFENRLYGRNFLYTSTFDEEWYTVQIPENGTAEISATNVPSNLDLNILIYQDAEPEPVLFDDDGDPNSDFGQSLIFETEEMEPGLYYIYIQDEGNNSFSEEYFDFCFSFESVLSAEDGGRSQFKMYPNPLRRSDLVIDGVKGNARIEIFDLAGKKVVDQDFNGSIHFSQVTFSSGKYTVSISQGRTVSTRKLVVLD